MLDLGQLCQLGGSADTSQLSESTGGVNVLMKSFKESACLPELATLAWEGSVYVAQPNIKYKH